MESRSPNLLASLGLSPFLQFPTLPPPRPGRSIAREQLSAPTGQAQWRRTRPCPATGAGSQGDEGPRGEPVLAQ